MKWWRRLSVRIPALVLVLTIGPLIFLGITAVQETDHSLREIIGQSFRDAATHSVDLAEASVRNTISKIRIVLNASDLSPEDPMDRQWLLMQLQREVPEVYSFTIISTDGNETERASREKIFKREDLKDRRNDLSFVQAIKGDLWVGEVETLSAGTQLLTITLPMIDPKARQVTGVLAAQLSVRNLLERITEMKVNGSGAVVVLDADGKLIAHPDLSRVLAGESHADTPHFRHLMQGEEEAFHELHVMAGTAGKEVLTTGLKSEFLGWVFMIEEPAAEALALVHHLRGKLVFLLGLIVVLVAAATLYLLMRLTRPLKRLQAAAEGVGGGQLGQRVDIATKDELGSVADAFNAMSSRLYTASVDKSRADWITTGLVRMNDVMRGGQKLASLCAMVVTEMAAYLDARVGVFYLMHTERRKDVLRLAASYAFDMRDSPSREFVPGEGLIGQAVLEGQPVVVRDVPDRYLDISSGLGDAPPRCLMVTPFVYEGRVKGAVELGTLEPATELQLEYLRQVAPVVAVTLETASGREQLAEALARSQAASEELQVQQEELRAANEELEEQSRTLKESEERLKVQQEELQAANEELEEKSEAMERKLR